jgi:hypothetical protein
MSVNLSARQLASVDAVERLCQVLGSSGLPPGAVELELTETLLVDRSDTMLARLHHLRKACCAQTSFAGDKFVCNTKTTIVLGYFFTSYHERLEHAILANTFCEVVKCVFVKVLSWLERVRDNAVCFDPEDGVAVIICWRSCGHR